MTKIKVGDGVAWNWGSGQGKGEVTKVHADDVEKTIKGGKVKRKASDSKPAVEVTADKGAKVLKSSSGVKIKQGAARPPGAGGR